MYIAEGVKVSFPVMEEVKVPEGEMSDPKRTPHGSNRQVLTGSGNFAKHS